MKSRKLVITPKMAEEYLKHNTSNRPINKTVMVAYAKDMVNGRWSLTHQGIAFDKDGNLVDGQHRLMAIIISGLEQELWVFYGVPQTPIMDRGLQRTIKDCLTFDGMEGVTKQHIALITCVKGSAKLGVFEAKDYLTRHQTNVQKALALTKGHVRLKPAPISAAMFVALENGIHEAVVAHFAEILGNGITVRPSDETIIRFRDKMQHTSFSSQKDRSDVFKIAMRVILAVAKDEKLTKLYVPDEPVFTLPE